MEKLKEKFTSQNRRYNHIQGSDSQRFALIVFGIPIGIWISINSLLFVMNYGLTVFLPQIIFLPLIIVLIFLISGFFLTKIYTKDILFPCFVVILLIPFFIPPVTSTLSQLQQAHDSLHYINIVSEPIDKYPVVLDNFRFVDSALFTDIIDSVKLPEPPKPYRVQVLDNYAAIGVVQGKPAFIAPMRYESTFLNPNTNVMAGYIALDLDNPIPESTIIKFTEMTIAPGLDGYKNIDLKLLQYAPDVFAGENYKYYLVDPWTDGHPAWIIPVSKYSPWGVDIPAGTVVVHSDGTFERLTVQESLQKGIPEPIAQDAFVNMIGSTIKFLRNNMIDPSSAGYLWLPSSPDVEQPITIDFYDRPHHILVNDHWFGRDYYLSARTGSKNSVVSWIMINNTIQMYDLRSYTKGGLVGVNTPDNALSDLSNIATSTGLANIDGRYPKLYRVPFGNATLLIWVSLLIETLPGYDRFAGAVFVDAANPRISGATVARLGESPQTFKERFVNAINLSYIGFLSGNQTISGQAQITNINNGTIIRTNWVLLQPNNQYGIVLYVKNQTKNIFILVTESSVATKDDFYTASILKPGDFVNIVARYDIDHQSWLAYKIQLL